MQKLLYSILSANRKRRSLTVNLALWLLRIVHGIEEDELNYYSDELEEFSSLSDTVSGRRYDVVEDECTDREFVLGFLISAIDDLEFVYGEKL